MNISAINLFNLNNNFAPRKVYPNLAPLNKDTVSFSARSELLAKSMVDIPQAHTTKKVEQNAAGACYYLYSVLDKYISDYADLKENHVSKDILKVRPRSRTKKSKYPKIATFEVRIKSSSSIREKVVSRYTKMYRNEHNQFAEELFTRLNNHIPMQPNVSKKDVIDLIKRCSKHSFGGNKVSAYNFTELLIDEVMKALDSYNYFDYSQVSEERKKAIISDISTNMSTKASCLMSSSGTYYEPKTINGIKYYANDIVGARILLKESDHEYTDKILGALKQAASDGVLKITSIENNVPARDKIPDGHVLSDYTYASDSAIRALSKVSGAEVITNESKTGYMAIHINVDLSDPIFKNYGGVFNGYSGEIQIIGRDVEQLKEVEDLCYKFKDNKNAVNKAYKPFKDHFLKYYNENTRQAFDDYTYDLYLAQRVIPPKKRRNSFPTIQELGYAGKVPLSLDFNLLKHMWEYCRGQQMIEEQESDKNTPETEKDIVSAGNVKTIKMLVDNKLNFI